MTDDIAGLVLAAAPTNATQETIISMNLCHPPIPFGFVVWTVCAVLLPLACAASFVRHWRLIRYGVGSFWQPRIITLAILVMVTATIIEIVSRVQLILFTMGTMRWGEAQQAMASISLSHACMVLTVAPLSTAVCIGFRVMLLGMPKMGDRQPTGARDGVPAAHDP